jgi:hypothetical protein
MMHGCDAVKKHASIMTKRAIKVRNEVMRDDQLRFKED